MSLSDEIASRAIVTGEPNTGCKTTATFLGLEDASSLFEQAMIEASRVFATRRVI